MLYADTCIYKVTEKSACIQKCVNKLTLRFVSFEFDLVCEQVDQCIMILTIVVSTVMEIIFTLFCMSKKLIEHSIIKMTDVLGSTLTII